MSTTNSLPSEPQSHALCEQDILQLLSKLADVTDELGRVIVGQRSVVQQLLVAMLAGGHCLLEGAPGLAKTLMVSSLAKTLELDYKRIQFTPDLMPSDIIGTEILETDHDSGERFFKFKQGPVFTHILLADEINRTPPKTQAALLEAMQERTISYAGNIHPLPKPFFVLATQNPVEQSGTYALPEAQLDRFLMFVRVGYPKCRRRNRDPSPYYWYPKRYVKRSTAHRRNTDIAKLSAPSGDLIRATAIHQSTRARYSPRY